MTHSRHVPGSGGSLGVKRHVPPAGTEPRIVAKLQCKSSACSTNSHRKSNHSISHAPADGSFRELRRLSTQRSDY